MIQVLFYTDCVSLWSADSCAAYLSAFLLSPAVLPTYIDLLAARVADAIDHEAGVWADAGQPLSETALEALQADLADAQAQGDGDRIGDLLQGLPGLAAEWVAFDREKQLQLA